MLTEWSSTGQHPHVTIGHLSTATRSQQSSESSRCLQFQPHVASSAHLRGNMLSQSGRTKIASEASEERRSAFGLADEPRFGSPRPGLDNPSHRIFRRQLRLFLGASISFTQTALDTTLSGFTHGSTVLDLTPISDRPDDKSSDTVRRKIQHVSRFLRFTSCEFRQGLSGRYRFVLNAVWRQLNWRSFGLKDAPVWLMPVCPGDTTPANMATGSHGAN
ncbi:unnamed protein product [Protopolystoma xenopodis]|uniref:Uncharacterized protein n=1 Tax=Protopolystoma xenopodis TaxID=117903 RepID=A0A3S5AIG9_9PLAT|nr:unnamed protein product [Protopolystoma xenopodis]